MRGAVVVAVVVVVAVLFCSPLAAASLPSRACLASSPAVDAADFTPFTRPFNAMVLVVVGSIYY